MPKRQDDRWILAIADTRKQLTKSIALFTNTPMCEIVDTAIKEYIERLQDGDYKKNLAEMKRKRKEYLKVKKMLADMERIKSEYSESVKELGIESSEEEILSGYLDR